MSNTSWKDLLNQALKKTPAINQASCSGNRQLLRLAIVGIGNELDGDDAAGVLAARALRPLLKDISHILVIDAGPAPENFTGPLRRHKPDLVVIIDAADIGKTVEPGTIAWVEWQDTQGLSASSHSLPPSVLAKFLIEETGCRVGLLAIQASQLDFAEPPAPPVQRAVDELVQYLNQLLHA
jgi:hydrogenase 3 maturation protease